MRITVVGEKTDMSQEQELQRVQICLRYVMFLLFIVITVVACSTSRQENDMPTPELMPWASSPAPTFRPTLTASPTRAPYLTPTPGPTYTSAPTRTIPVFTPTETVEPMLGSATIAYRIYGEWGVYLLDLETGYSRPIPHPVLALLAWSGNGCELVVETYNNDGNAGGIDRVDLRGNVLQELLSPDDLPPGAREITLSPGEDWIAYRNSEGEPLGGYDPVYEFENIEVMAVGGGSGPYRLTTGNGGREAAWSPDGERLAYGDFDADGIYQLYVSLWDGSERTQVTYFTEVLTTEIRQIQWSPDGERIAFAYKRQGNIAPMTPRKTDLMIVTLSDPAYPIVIAEQIYLVMSLWWQDNNTVVGWVVPEPWDPTKVTDMALYWVEASSGQILHYVHQRETPPGSVASPGPLTLNRVGFFAVGKFYIYDVDTQTFEQKDNVLVYDVGIWLAPPGTFQGEQGCNPP